MKGMKEKYMMRSKLRVEKGKKILFNEEEGGVGMIEGKWEKKIGEKVIGKEG